MTSENKTLPELGWSNFFQSQLSIEECETLEPLRVTDVHRNAVDTIGQTGASRVVTAGPLAEHGVAVGDWIVIDRETTAPIRVLDRVSFLARRASGDAPSAQLIAANVNTLFIVSSCNADYNVARLERYLALARQAEIEPVVILTKADLCDEPVAFRQRAESDLPGVLVETVTATSPDTASQLSVWCSKGQTVALLGSSGVGKTTLINTMTGIEGHTMPIREDDAKGRHTTTARSMHPATLGGWVIDTPGMRALRLADVADGIDAVFEDVSSLIGHCRFNDCAHETEPGCAVQAAISAGTLDSERFRRWQKLQREDRRHSETLAQSRARTRALEKTYRSGAAKGRKKRGESS